jgi:hypothetical protein
VAQLGVSLSDIGTRARVGIPKGEAALRGLAFGLRAAHRGYHFG